MLYGVITDVPDGKAPSASWSDENSEINLSIRQTAASTTNKAPWIQRGFPSSGLCNLLPLVLTQASSMSAMTNTLSDTLAQLSIGSRYLKSKVEESHAPQWERPMW